MGCCFGKQNDRAGAYRLEDERNFDGIGSDTIGGGSGFGSDSMKPLGNTGGALGNTGGFGNTSFGNTGGGGGFGSDSIGFTPGGAIGFAPGGAIGNTGGGFGNTAFRSAGGATASPQPKRPDPKDYMFSNLKAETKVKEPGSVNGQQFIIEDCEDCDLYVFDDNAAVTIDECKNCRIFIGPCDSSIFIRDCYNCKLVFFCRQFRTRNCEDCDFSLYCATRPIIESSKRLRFACIDFHYDGLEANMKACGLSKYNNYWSYIHDFTKAAGNFSYLPATTRSDDLLAPLPSAKCLNGKGTANPPPFVLRTWGERDPISNETAFAMLPEAPEQERQADYILTQMQAEGVLLVHANRAILDADTAKQMVAMADGEVLGDEKKLCKTLAKGKAIGLEFGGPGCMQMLRSVMPPGDFICTSSSQASSTFRYMGIEG